jgi:putative ABC transport system ATP-binding protein
VLKLDNIRKTFEHASSPILDDVSLSLASGHSLAIMGASGSGKSTLLNIIAGLIAPDGGSVEFNGQVVTSLRPAQKDRFRAENFGMVFQQFNLIDSLNLEDNVSLPARYLGSKHADYLDELLNQLSINHRRSDNIEQLSGGEQQRVAIARALINKPDLVLADEPTGNLDTQTSEEVCRLLYDLTTKSQTALMIVTHSMEVAERADRILWLKQGKLSE